MVNDQNFKRQTILSMLRNADKPLSGQLLAENLDVSRVAVWKQINSLKELGYDIVSTPNGYILEKDSDHLYSWEFSEERENYHSYKVLNSTMEQAALQAEQGCPSFTTIVAETQTGGKGRGDRTWISSDGGLYFTWVIRAELPLAYHYIYTLAAAIAITQTAGELYNIELETKWPNDVFRQGKKVAGILAEMKCSGDSLTWLNLGIGINVNNDPSLKSGISLSEIAGRSLDRKEILTTLESSFKNILSEYSPEEIRNIWSRQSCTIGKTVTLKPAKGPLIEGNALNLDAAGALVVETDKGIKQQALFGDHYIKETGDLTS